MKMDQFEITGEVLDECSAAFHPVAAVEVAQPVDRPHLGAMDVATNDSVDLAQVRETGHRVFVLRDELHGGLGLVFEVGGDRPITKTKLPARPVHPVIEIEDDIVESRTDAFQQPVEMGKSVKLMAVNDQIPPAVGPAMIGLANQLHAAEPKPDVILQELVVIPCDVGDFCAFAVFA